MRKTYAGPLTLAAALVAAGCGGGDGGTAVGVIPEESRTFDFTVSVTGTSSSLGGVAFFRDQALTQSGVSVESGTQVIARPSASVQGQEVIQPIPSNATLAVHFDASGSMARSDPSRNRFTAADIAVGRIGQLRPQTQTRVYTFRFDDGAAPYGQKRFTLDGGPFAASDDAAAQAARTAAENRGQRANSPALSATHNIIGSGNGTDGSLPSDTPHAMLLLTDGENNAEDPAIVPSCTVVEGGQGETSGCGNIAPVVNRAINRQTRVFVAGFGNNDEELGKFRNLADQTSGAYVKATRAEELGTQFRNVAELMASGGVVVRGRTGEVTVTEGGNPFIRGWMRFDKVGGACPGGAAEHDAATCKLAF